MRWASLAKLPADLSKKPFETLLFRMIGLDGLGCRVLNVFPSVAAKYIELLEGPIVGLFGIKGDNLLKTIRTHLDTCKTLAHCLIRI